MTKQMQMKTDNISHLIAKISSLKLIYNKWEY